MLFDKISGFYTVLHASMAGQDGPTYCPRGSVRHIKEGQSLRFLWCSHVFTCFQSVLGVPADRQLPASVPGA